METGTVIGIDAGGTSSRIKFKNGESSVRLADGPSCIVNQKQGDAPLNRLASHIREEIDRGNAPQPKLVRASIAGCARPENALRATHIFQSFFPHTKIEVFSDVAAAFAAAHPEKNENHMLLICGTGSVLTFESGSFLKLIGGFGPATDEYGSARLITRHTLTLAAELIDQRLTDDDLLNELTRTGIAGKTRSEFGTLLNREKQELLQLIPRLCFKLAQSGHHGCELLTDRHLSKLSDMIAAARRVNPQLSVLALHGGLFHNTWFRKRVTETFANQEPDVLILDSITDVPEFLCLRDHIAPPPFYQEP